MKISSLVLTLTFLCSGPVFASFGGDEKGNGGIVTMCDVNGQKVYEVFDLYEGRTFHKLNLQLEQGANYSEIVNKMIARLDRLNPSRANLYRSYFSEFAKEANFVSGADFNPTPDIGGGVKPENCDLVQVVIQFRKPNLSGFRYYVNQLIWNQLDEVNKAALVMHEMIYREGLKEENAFTSSVGVRYFNAVIQSNILPTLSLQNYIEQVLGYSFFTDADANGVPIRLHTSSAASTIRPLTVTFWNQATVRQAALGETLEVLVPHQRKIRFKCQIGEGLEKLHRAEFYQTGELRSVKLGCLNRFNVSLQYKDITGGVFIDNLYYDLQGNLESIEAYSSKGYVPVAFAYRSPDFNIVRSLSDIGDDLLLKFDKQGVPSFLCYGKDQELQNNWFQINGEVVGLAGFVREHRIGGPVGITFNKEKLLDVESTICSAGQQD